MPGKDDGPQGRLSVVVRFRKGPCLVLAGTDRDLFPRPVPARAAGVGRFPNRPRETPPRKGRQKTTEDRRGVLSLRCDASLAGSGAEPAPRGFSARDRRAKFFQKTLAFGRAAPYIPIAPGERRAFRFSDKFQAISDKFTALSDKFTTFFDKFPNASGAPEAAMSFVRLAPGAPGTPGREDFRASI